MGKRAQPAQEKVLSMLRETPSRIAETFAGVELADLRAAPAPGEWSANEVLAHLRACADVWGDAIDVILSENDPVIRAISPRRWPRLVDYANQDARSSLRSFAAQRAKLVAVLERLSPRSWTRRATVKGAGKPLTRTVLDYAQWLARHEQPHIDQIAKTIGSVTNR